MKQLEWKPVSVSTVKDLDEDAQGRIVTSIEGNFRDWRALRRGHEDVWTAIDRHLNQYDPINTPLLKLEYGHTIDGPNNLGSKLKMSNVYSHREGIVAAIMKFLMVNDYDFFDIVPLDPMDNQSCQAVKEYLLWLFDMMDFENEFLPFLRGIVTYGTGIASYEWVEEGGIRWKTEEVPNPETGETVQIRYQAPDLIYNAPKFTPINLYRAVIDPAARDVRTATLIFQKLITPHEIMANPAYGSLDEDWLFGTPDAGADEDSVREVQREQARGNETFEATGAYRGRKKVYEAWGDFTDGRILYQNYVAEIMDHRLIRFEPNPYNMPYKPFVIARYSVEDGSVYGKSPLAAITALQAGYDTLFNQAIDANAMHNERPILLQANSLVQDKVDKKTPPPLGKNAVWRMRDVTGATRMRDPDFVNVGEAVAPLLQVLEKQMDAATGDNELMSGGGGLSDQYATTGHVVTVAEAGNARFNLYSKTIEREAIVRVLEMTVDLLKQRTLEPKTFQASDPSQGQQIQFHPEMLLNNIAFSMRGASYNATKQLQVNAMQNFYTLLTQNPITLQLMNWARVVIDFGDAMGIRAIRSQLSTQALVALQSTPPQPTWWENVMGLLSGQQQAQSTMPQIPGLGQQQPMENDTSAQTNTIAPAFGGSNPANTTQSPFNLSPTPLNPGTGGQPPLLPGGVGPGRGGRFPTPPGNGR